MLNAVLLVAVAVLYFLHFNQPDSAAQKAAVSVGVHSNNPNPLGSVLASGTGNNIVFVNTDTLLEHYNFFTSTKSQLESRGKRLETELQGRMMKLEKEYETARSKVQQGTMSNSLMQETEKDLMRKQQELAAYKDEQAGKLMEEEKKINIQLNDNIRNFLKVYGKENGYKYVLGMSGAGGILYANDSLDITSHVLDGLNKASEK